MPNLPEAPTGSAFLPTSRSLFRLVTGGIASAGILIVQFPFRRVPCGETRRLLDDQPLQIGLNCHSSTPSLEDKPFLTNGLLVPGACRRATDTLIAHLTLAAFSLTPASSQMNQGFRFALASVHSAACPVPGLTRCKSPLLARCGGGFGSSCRAGKIALCCWPSSLPA